MRTSCITQIEHKQNLDSVVLLLLFHPVVYILNNQFAFSLQTVAVRPGLVQSNTQWMQLKENRDTGYNVSVT